MVACDLSKPVFQDIGLALHLQTVAKATLNESPFSNEMSIVLTFPR